ncbi:unnamed protein product [Linum trigynum]|uniref:Uncharacterized protein n=1 Tax=Linum trigynum TaxID=586398 RepID=A0AAV2F8S3_9ROSI
MDNSISRLLEQMQKQRERSAARKSALALALDTTTVEKVTEWHRWLSERRLTTEEILRVPLPRQPKPSTTAVAVSPPPPVAKTTTVAQLHASFHKKAAEANQPTTSTTAVSAAVVFAESVTPSSISANNPQSHRECGVRTSSATRMVLRSTPAPSIPIDGWKFRKKKQPLGEGLEPENSKAHRAESNTNVMAALHQEKPVDDEGTTTNSALQPATGFTAEIAKARSSAMTLARLSGDLDRRCNTQQERDRRGESTLTQPSDGMR